MSYFPLIKQSICDLRNEAAHEVNLWGGRTDLFDALNIRKEDSHKILHPVGSIHIEHMDKTKITGTILPELYDYHHHFGP